MAISALSIVHHIVNTWAYKQLLNDTNCFYFSQNKTEIFQYITFIVEKYWFISTYMNYPVHKNDKVESVKSKCFGHQIL